MAERASDQYLQWRYDDALPRGCADYVSPAVIALLESAGAGPRVLDVGCGNGALAGQLATRGYRVVGVDLSKPGIAIARDTPAGAV